MLLYSSKKPRELRSELFPTQNYNTVILKKSKMYYNFSSHSSKVLLLLLPLFTFFEIQVNTSYNHLSV